MSSKNLNDNLKRFLFLFISLGLLSFPSFSQSVPREEEKIEYLVTFGKDAPADWGDDDHSQVYFFMVPEDCKDQLFIRVFDPDVGGEIDENRGGFNSRTKFTVYGGKGAFTPAAARETDPVGNYDDGEILDTKSFGEDSRYDSKWHSFGPFDATQGEKFDGFGKPKYIFKVIAQGFSGDDGNLYKYFFSADKDRNIDVEGSDTFTFEYSFRLPRGKCHIYPFMDDAVTSVKLHNFDFDKDGFMKLSSNVRTIEKIATSGDGDWKISEHKVYEEEKGKVLDIQIISFSKKNNNNVVFYVHNQYGETMPFFNFPIGLMPRKAKIGIEPQN